MAKIQKKYSFKNASITYDDGKYELVEVEKNEMRTYDLTAVLNEFLGEDNVTLVIGTDGDFEENV